MIQQWLKAQQIGLAAYCARAFATSSDKRAIHLRNEGIVRLPCLLAEWGWQNKHNMCSLPPSILYQLAEVPDEQLNEPFDRGRLQASARDAIAYLLPTTDSPFAKSMAMAHHIMHGTGSAKRLTRLGASLYSHKRSSGGRRQNATWVELGQGEELQRLDGALQGLRDTFGATADRVKEVGALADLMGCSSATAQISALLYSHMFCWPQLVFRGPNGDFAISLPLAADVDLTQEYGYKHQIRVCGNYAFDLSVKGGDGNGWENHLRRAREAGQLLWSRAHGNSGTNLRQRVRTHQVTYDFTWASQIASGAVGVNADNRIPLSGGSAAAYLAQIVLARLLGRRWYLSSAVTGLIGERVKNEQGEEERDFWFDPPGGVAAKVRYIFATRTFERIVLPKHESVVNEVASVRDGEQRSPHSQVTAAAPEDTEVLYAAKLSNIADIVQVGGWRKTAFIRCPEVAWSLYGTNAPGALPPEHFEVEKVLARLATHPRCVLRIDDVGPLAVASALGHVNRRIHEANQPTSPPGLSWCIVRAVEEEQDAAFWCTVWRLIGAPLSDYELICDSPTREIAARRLAWALNQFAPTEMHPSHRAPDVLVIVGAERFTTSFARNRTPCSRPLAVGPLLDQFEETNGLRISSERLRPGITDHIGPVRLVLVAEQSEISTPQDKRSCASDVTQFERRAIEALATFRFGFSHSMAATMLSGYGLHGGDVRDFLHRLVGQGLLREALGQFHMVEAHRAEIGQLSRHDFRSLATRHRAAGIALAPYTVAAPVPSLSYDASFLPENVSEAQFHFVRSCDLFGKVHDNVGQASVRRELSHLSRFAVLPNWGAVDRLNRARFGHDAYELALELMDDWTNHPDNKAKLPAHPIHYAEAMDALMNWEPQRDRKSEIDRMFNEGLSACHAFPEERAFCQLRLLCAMSVYLYRWWPELEETMSELDDRIWNLEADWNGVPGDWFEKNGDSEPQHERAVRHYRLGTVHAPTYVQNWIKYLGAAQLSGLNATDLRRALGAMDRKEATKIVRWATAAFEKEKRRKETTRRTPAILSRLNAAFPVLRELWPHNASLQTWAAIPS